MFQNAFQSGPSVEIFDPKGSFIVFLYFSHKK